MKGRSLLERRGASSRRWSSVTTAVVVAAGLHIALVLLLARGVPGVSGTEAVVNVVLVESPPVQELSSAAADSETGAAGKPAGDEGAPRKTDVGEGDGEGLGRKLAAETLPAPTPASAPAGGGAKEPAYQQLGGEGDDVLLGGFVDNGYRGALLRHIRRFRLYPTDAVVRRAEGVTILRFRVTREGSVEEAWVARRSADPALDRAALETLWRAEPLPAVPDDMPAPVEVELPVPFRLPRR